MGTDTTELTFVRCPECRSLVPATSVRCRMCGSGLVADAKKDTETASAQTTRVRQNTTITPSSEIMDQISQVRSEETAPITPVVSSPVINNVEAANPLDEFLSEDEIEEKHEPIKTNVAEKIYPQDFKDDENDDEDDEDDDFDDFDDLEELDDIEEVEPQEVVQPVKVQDVKVQEVKPPVPVETQKPRVVVEQGKGKFSKGLSFGAPKRFDAPAKPIQEPNTTTQHAPQNIQQKPFVDNKKFEKSPAFENSKKDVIQPKPKPITDTTKKVEQTGRLYGWMVTYNDPKGSSMELREGRFFVTNSELRPTDLVLNNPTISVPHAMFHISTDSGISIQDLKSDKGVFVKDNTSGTYVRYYDSVVLKHGDWVKFGDLEFLICVISNVPH